MRESWRWFGINDPIQLSEIKETGATEVVTALHHIPCGESWPEQDIINIKHKIEISDLSWKVVESLPVHESIKQGLPEKDGYIQTYIRNMERLAKHGIEVICYNFMPVTDWTRTSIDAKQRDGSITLEFDAVLYIVYDLFLLQRDHARNDYTEQQIDQAQQRFEQLTEIEKQQLIKVIGMGLPGTVDNLSVELVREHIMAYRHINTDSLRKNHTYFLKQIIPHAERLGLQMAVHPDDPPMPLLGLPRIVSTKEDLQFLFDAVPSLNNGLTLCVGSLGAGINNHVIEITKRFSDRIHFVHLRNVAHTGQQFIEAPHLDGDQDMIAIIKILLKEEERRNISLPYRPDHGSLMLTDKVLQNTRNYYPGYSLIGRMKGLAELRGAICALRHRESIH